MRIAALFFRRTLDVRFCSLLALFFLLALLTHGTPPAYLEGLPPTRDDLFMRRGMWLIAALFALPVLVLRAASIATDWDRRERFWIGSRPVTASGSMVTMACGTWLAGLTLILGTAGVSEVAAGESPPARQLLLQLEHPSLALLANTRSARLDFAELPLVDDALLSFRLTPIPGATPTAEATVRLEESSGGRPITELRVRMGQPGREELPLTRSRSVSLIVDGETGANCVLPDNSIELLAADRDPRRTTWLLLLEAALGWSAWCTLAFAAGVWMRPKIAAFLCLAICCLPLALELPPQWLPGAGFVQGLSSLDRGLIPAPVSPLSWAVTGASLLLASLFVGARLYWVRSE